MKVNDYQYFTRRTLWTGNLFPADCIVYTKVRMRTLTARRAQSRICKQTAKIWEYDFFAQSHAVNATVQYHLYCNHMYLIKNVNECNTITDIPASGRVALLPSLTASGKACHWTTTVMLLALQNSWCLQWYNLASMTQEGCYQRPRLQWRRKTPETLILKSWLLQLAKVHCFFLARIFEHSNGHFHVLSRSTTCWSTLLRYRYR